MKEKTPDPAQTLFQEVYALEETQAILEQEKKGDKSCPLGFKTPEDVKNNLDESGHIRCPSCPNRTVRSNPNRCSEVCLLYALTFEKFGRSR